MSVKVVGLGSAYDVTFAGEVSGSGGLLKTQPGKLTLTGSSSYTGGTSIASDRLVISWVGALPMGQWLSTGKAIAAMAYSRIGHLIGRCRGGFCEHRFRRPRPR